MEFLSENWKWSVSTLIALLGIVVPIYVSRRNKDKPRRNKQTIEEGDHNTQIARGQSEADQTIKNGSNNRQEME